MKSDRLTVLIIYKTDVWHTHASRELLGIATSRPIAIKICKAQAKKEGAKISEDDLYNLEHINQTQGYYEGIGEFLMEEIQTNILL